MPDSIFEDLVVRIDEDIPTHFITRNPRPSRALRKAGASPASMGGTLLNSLDNREFGYDSDLERRWIMQYLQDPEVTSVEGQRIETAYVDRNGVPRKTIWDLMITYESGHRELVSVKRLEIALTAEFQADFARMCAHVPVGVADSARVATEWALDPCKIDRGLLFNKALSGNHPKFARAVLDFIRGQQQPTRIEKICEFYRTNLAPVAPQAHFHALSVEFWTVIWLLAKRAIIACGDDYLTMKSEVAAR